MKGVAIAGKLWRGGAYDRGRVTYEGRCRRSPSLRRRAELLGAGTVLNLERGGAKARRRNLIQRCQSHGS